MGLRYQKGDLTMLDAKDLELLRNMIGEVVEEKVNPKFETIDRRFETLEEKVERRFEEFEDKMEARIHESENAILSELDRVQKHLEERIDKVQENVDELNRCYRITKLENENTTLLLRWVDTLAKRVDALEEKIA